MFLHLPQQPVSAFCTRVLHAQPVSSASCACMPRSPASVLPASTRAAGGATSMTATAPDACAEGPLCSFVQGGAYHLATLVAVAGLGSKLAREQPIQPLQQAPGDGDPPKNSDTTSGPFTMSSAAPASAAAARASTCEGVCVRQPRRHRMGHGGSDADSAHAGAAPPALASSLALYR